MTEQKDTEIVLGTGKMLGIFFVLVAICGTFFGLGYSLGHSSSPVALQSHPITIVAAAPAKPAAGVTVTSLPPDCATSAAGCAANTASTATAQPAPPVTQPEDAISQPGSDSNEEASEAPATKPLAQPATTKSTPAPELKGAPGGISVQVAAVTKQEDAEALVSALRRKNYPVFVASVPAADNLYHVQVGPFPEMKDAEAMRSRLAGDGYNAIIKK
jgi:DedD protein